MSLTVVALRRYPVKCMGGEEINRADLDARGILGDRWFAVEDANGHFASGKNTRRFRRRDPVFQYFAATTDDGVRVSRNGASWPVGDTELNEELSARTGVTVRVTEERDVPHQDAGSISIIGTATLDWCAARWGIDADARRLRANIVLNTAEPFVEETWIGRELHIGSSILRVAARAERCRTVDLAQDGITPTGRWLKPLAQERDMKLAVYADVLQPGAIDIGDEVVVDQP